MTGWATNIRQARSGWQVRARRPRGWAQRQRPTPPAPSTAWRDRVGFGVHIAYAQYSQVDADRIMAVAASVGALWVRDEFTMNVCNPAAGVYNWTYTDRLMRAAASVGIRVAAVVAYGVQWSSGQANIKYPPQADDYATFCGAIVTRYGTGGTFWAENPTLPAVPLAVMIFWNEPWLNRHWLPEPSPAGYCALVRAGTTAVNAVDPAVTCLMSVDLDSFNSASTRSPWMTALFAADATINNVVDAYLIHAYNSPKQRGPYDFSAVGGADSTERYLTIQANLAAMGRSRPVWITEVGWSTNPDGGDEYVTQEVAGQFYEDMCVRAMQDWDVPRLFLFNLARYTTGQTDPRGPAAFGMLNNDWSEMPSLGRVRRYLGG